MSDDEQEFAITPLASGASELHEIYLAYMDAGFPEARAFELAAMILMNHLGN